jgi:Skp family chaperone for outer membrane proteins
MSENNETAQVGSTSDVAVDAVDSFDLDALINTHFEDPIMSEPGLEHKIGIPYEDVIKHIPENGRKVIQNLRASYTRKTQELANERKELESLREKLTNQQRLMTDSAFAKQVKELASDDKDHDIWDDDGRRSQIKKEAAIMMQEMLKPLQQEVTQERRALELDRFKAEHQDLPELRVDIAKLLTERKELKLEDAYYIVKAKREQQLTHEEKVVRAAKREESRTGLYKTSNGKNVDSGKLTQPKFKSAWDAYLWNKSNGVK